MGKNEDPSEFWALQGYKIDQWEHFVSFLESYLSKRGFENEKINRIKHSLHSSMFTQNDNKHAVDDVHPDIIQEVQ